MGLADELGQAAEAAASFGTVSGVLPAEPAGRRFYLVAVGEGESPEWVVLDDAFSPVRERTTIREVASIVVLCELAAELAGGGQLEELRARLAELRMTEQPPGIEAAEAAALELERTLGAAPVVASPAYLDAVGAATKKLEEALGDQASPFATSLAASSGTVEAFVAEVEGRQPTSLR
jgi:hypothetical protein